MPPSRQPGAEGTDGSVGLKVMPIDSVTMSDTYSAGERAPTPVRRGRRPDSDQDAGRPDLGILCPCSTQVIGGHPHDAAIGMRIAPVMAGAWRCPVIGRQILGSMSGEQPMNRDGR